MRFILLLFVLLLSACTDTETQKLKRANLVALQATNVPTPPPQPTTQIQPSQLTQQTVRPTETPPPIVSPISPITERRLVCATKVVTRDSINGWCWYETEVRP
jgi:hypothetical protein